MAEILLLKWSWLFLALIVSRVSANSFSVVVPKTPITGLSGASVTLPCTLSQNLDARKFEVRWYRPLMYNSPALWFQNEKLVISTDVEHRGRVSLVGPLEKGDVSLKLDNLRPTDKGTYLCHVSSDTWYDKSNVSLIIQAVGSSPVLSVVDAGEGKVNVSCHSHGWLPKPSLSWRNSAGKSLEHLNEHTSTSDSDGLFSVRSWLLFSPSESSWLSCSVALPDSSTGIKESRVMPHVPPVVETWKGAFVATLIILLLLIIGVGVYCVLKQWKNRTDSKEKKTEDRKENLALNKVEIMPLLDPHPIADTPQQPVVTGILQVNEVEEMELQETLTEDTPPQSQFKENHYMDLRRTTSPSPAAGGNPNLDPQQNLNSSPNAAGNQDQSPGPNHNSSPPAGGNQNLDPQRNLSYLPNAEGNQDESPGPYQKSSPPAGGNQNLDPQQNLNSLPNAGGNQDQSAEPNQKPSPPADNQLPNHSEHSPKKPHNAVTWEQVKKFKVNITIDPKETPEFFRVTHGGKRVICPQTKENQIDKEHKIFTLCKEKFSSGQQYWELKLCKKPKEKLSWFVGVATNEAESKYRITLTPENGFWVLCYEEENQVYIRESQEITTPLPDVGDDLTTVGVFLDCDNHTLSFYNTKTRSEIYTFTNITFRTSLRPLISPGIRDTNPVHIPNL